MNKQYNMSTSDINKFREIKESSLYKDYINTIINSPILINIANEHIKNIDITDDIDVLISKSSNASAKKLNTLFKDTLRSMAVNMIADSLIIKDIIDVGFNDAMEDLENDFKVKYLMGLADKHFYDEAEKTLSENPDTSSLLYIGYTEYKKRKDKNTLNKLDISEFISKPKPAKKESIKKEPIKKEHTKKAVDLSSNDIEF